MRRTSIRTAWLLAATALLCPARAFSQGQGDYYAPPDVTLPSPLYSTRPADGGLFIGTEFVMYHVSNPLQNQEVARRGFIDANGSLSGVVGGFVGSGTEALDTNQVRGPSTYTPGFKVDAGWRFGDGSAITVGYMYLTNATYSAAATSAPKGLKSGADLSDSFLTAGVYNFPSDFAGQPFKVSPGSQGTGLDSNNQFLSPFAYALYGIWDGAGIMTESYVQRVQQYEATYRMPIYETENYRMSGLVGPRFVWIWEQYQWRTTSLDYLGNSGPQDVAIYNNIDSNRMYGAHVGVQNEWYLGHGFAASLDLQAAAFFNSVKEKEDYQTGVKYIEGGFNPVENKRAKVDYTFVPELQATVGVMWYPYEGIQVHVGYDLAVFFNTISSQQPVSFNYGALDAAYQHVTHTLDGFQAGIAFVF